MAGGGRINIYISYHHWEYKIDTAVQQRTSQTAQYIALWPVHSAMMASDYHKQKNAQMTCLSNCSQRKWKCPRGMHALLHISLHQMGFVELCLVRQFYSQLDTITIESHDHFGRLQSLVSKSLDNVLLQCKHTYRGALSIPWYNYILKTGTCPTDIHMCIRADPLKQPHSRTHNHIYI